MMTCPGLAASAAKIYLPTPLVGLQPVNGPASLSRIILVIPTFSPVVPVQQGYHMIKVMRLAAASVELAAPAARLQLAGMPGRNVA